MTGAEQAREPLPFVSDADRKRWASEALFGPHHDYLWPNRFRALNAEYERSLAAAEAALREARAALRGLRFAIRSMTTDGEPTELSANVELALTKADAVLARAGEQS